MQRKVLVENIFQQQISAEKKRFDRPTGAWPGWWQSQ
ncbi:hypothetical protein N008_15235 [Hymenobacter sp. APR13]|nr:hypothetical protein N008_15235 [Hymenobacter sp. APR13]